jgi:hypothetical protein
MQSSRIAEALLEQLSDRKNGRADLESKQRGTATLRTASGSP